MSDLCNGEIYQITRRPQVKKDSTKSGVPPKAFGVAAALQDASAFGKGRDPIALQDASAVKNGSCHNARPFFEDPPTRCFGAASEDEDCSFEDENENEDEREQGRNKGLKK